MPIVTIQCVGNADGEWDENTTQGLADELGRLFGSEPGGTWLRLTHLPRTQYAENETMVPPNVQPTFVEVMQGTLPADLAQQAEQVAAIVARQLGRSQANVHVFYMPPAGGRVAFGGQLAG